MTGESPRTPRDEEHITIFEYGEPGDGYHQRWTVPAGTFQVGDEYEIDAPMADREPSPLPADPWAIAVKNAADALADEYVARNVQRDHVALYPPTAKVLARVALKAAGVPALLARIEEQAHENERLRYELADNAKARARIEELEAALARALRSVCNERHGGAFTDGHRCEECERYYPEMFR